MAHAFNRAMEIMGWRVPAESEEDVDLSLDEETQVSNVREFPFKPSSDGKVRAEAITTTASVAKSDLSRIVSLRPESFVDSRAVGEALREGNPVIMNLSDVPEAEARRILDFVTGVSFGLHGNVERVTNRVFLFSPRDVQVDSDSELKNHAQF